MISADRPGAPAPSRADEPYDLLVIGSGFGGAMAAAPAVLAGRRVVMVEAGDWVARGPDAWTERGFFERSPSFSRDTPFDATAEGERSALGTFLCVGGASVFFGGVSMRMREADFTPDPDIVQDSGAEWPYTYADLEPFYSQAEALLQVAGTTGEDPTEPPRSAAYPQPPAPLASISRRLATAARELGLHPFRLPLAINYLNAEQRAACQACSTCDGYACAIHAKNDISTTLLPRLQRSGLDLRTNTRAVRIEHEGGRVTRVVCLRPGDSQPLYLAARRIVAAAGTLNTPRLLLASGLDKINPAGHAVGRYLMRHCNAVVLGVFRSKPAPNDEFHKQIGIHDFYFGHPSVGTPTGRLGCLQQFGTPRGWIVRDRLPLRLGVPVSWFAPLTSGFIVMAEDRPRAGNRVALAEPSTLGLETPNATLVHDYDARDLAARAALVGKAKQILRRAGALPYCPTINIPSFSHAVGTVRLGTDPQTSPLDGYGAFRGLEHLYVTDGSALPRSAGVNPSLTISANALRTGHHILKTLEGRSA